MPQEEMTLSTNQSACDKSPSVWDKANNHRGSFPFAGDSPSWSAQGREGSGLFGGGQGFVTRLGRWKVVRGVWMSIAAPWREDQGMVFEARKVESRILTLVISHLESPSADPRRWFSMGIKLVCQGFEPL